MADRCLIDTGPLIALFHSGDNYHKKVCDFFNNQRFCFISTLAVFTEVSYFLSVNQNAQMDFFRWVVHQGVIISDINQNDMLRIAELMEKYADLPMDFADATLVVAAEKSGIRKIISLDKDFDVYRLPDREKIRNVFTKKKN